jgi:hypothetical protein
MPLEDRAADTWEPLIALADLAGNDWPQRARTAALALTADRDAATDEPTLRATAHRLPCRVRPYAGAAT